MADVTEEERELIKWINKGNQEEILRLLSSGVRVNCLDEHGMTPLMHAAYKGQADVCELLLARGADVNSNLHEHQYTALMFGCLSGSLDTTRILLDAGANVSAQNNLRRTAAQMGAFVGRHDCVSLINNFISSEDLEYYTKLQGLEKEPKLHKKLAPSLHKFITFSNLNPVKLVLNLKNQPELLEEYSSATKVLQLKAESLVKGKEMNEIMAMKLHYLACLLKKAGRWHQGLDGNEGIAGLIKHFAKGRASDGFPLGMEDFIRQSIKDFDYPECTVFRQLVKIVAPVEKGKDPTALSALTQVINGIQSADFSDSCSVCNQRGDLKKCSACKMVHYCSVFCQKLHWSTHKKFCPRLMEEYEKIQKQQQELEQQQQQQEKQVEQQQGQQQQCQDEVEQQQQQQQQKLPQQQVNGNSENSNDHV